MLQKLQLLYTARCVERREAVSCTLWALHFLRVRKKQPDTSACENYRPGGTNEAAFVTKEYLRKELLSDVLNMELLPDIQDDK